MRRRITKARLQNRRSDHRPDVPFRRCGLIQRTSIFGYVLIVLFLVGVAGTTGCDDQATKQARASFWKTQQQGLEKHIADWELRVKRETAEWERSVQLAKSQEARYESLLARWEQQADRTDLLLDKWAQILGTFEDRSGQKSGR